MLKEMLQSLFGVILTFAGIFVLYLFITSLDKQANFLYFGLSLVLVGGAIFLFIRAEKSDPLILKRTEPESESITIPFIPKKEKNTPDVLAKNNEMVKEWNETNAKRDKLKAAQISATPVQDTGD
jgi:hypothetical protein